MGRPAKFDDDEVLDRAMYTFWRQGWSATSIRDLERHLELKAPSIYRRFGDKDGLARAVLQRYLDRIIDRRIARHLSGAGDPVANIRSFFASALQPGPDGEPPIGCLLTITATERPTVPSQLGEPLVEGLERIEEALTHELGRARDAGRWPGSAEPTAAAGLLALVLQGLMVLVRAGFEPNQLLDRAEASLDLILGARSDSGPAPRPSRSGI
jgi:TetR/AcrR family transcriptional regulator, transcriptional repressor for nem operon